MFIKKLISYLLIVFVCLVVFCGQKKSEISQNKILARIGDRVITTDEFIRRAEYTIRPSYCRLDNYIHRKVVLNSLIGEKLLAMETDEDNPLLKSEAFVDYIKGRKEQAMRQLMYFDEAYHKVKVDSNEIRKEFQAMGKKYKISYISVPDSIRARSLRDSLNTGRYDLKSIVARFGRSEALPQREVTWENKEEKQIHEALYNQDVKKGQVIGPISVDEDNYLFIQVEGWTNSIALNEQLQAQRWEDAKDRLTDEKAEALWTGIVQKIMQDKRLEFVEDTFWKLNQMYYDMYMITEQEKRDEFNKRFWEKKDVEKTLEDIPDDETILNYPFFKLDGKLWTVRDFKKMIASHPLVFRKKRIKKSEFPEQLKFAIADLMRDKFVTDEAYQKGYDRRDEVQRNARMWEDAALAMYQREVYLKKIGELKDFKANKEKSITKYLNPYIDNLQAKYQDQIQINMNAFEKIKLTRIDMFAKQPDQPYPVVVPSFPVITTDNRLDYGSRLDR